MLTMEIIGWIILGLFFAAAAFGGYVEGLRTPLIYDPQKKRWTALKR